MSSRLRRLSTCNNATICNGDPNAVQASGGDEMVAFGSIATCTIYYYLATKSGCPGIFSDVTRAFEPGLVPGWNDGIFWHSEMR
jgi:hypothetical protein